MQPSPSAEVQKRLSAVEEKHTIVFDKQEHVVLANHETTLPFPL